jgi:hypothetical protein
MKFLLKVSECVYSPKMMFWCDKCRNNLGGVVEFGTFYTATFRFFFFFVLFCFVLSTQNTVWKDSFSLLFWGYA